jgi:antitoxin VapB
MMVELHPEVYHSTMALNIKDLETEQLAAEVAALGGESKTRAINIALRERKDRLMAAMALQNRSERLRRFLTDEAWPQIPADVLGTTLTKAEREQILGYGEDGV